MSGRLRYGILLPAVLLFIEGRTASAAAYSIDLFNNTAYAVDLINPKTGRAIATIRPGRSLAVAYREGVSLRSHDGRQLHYDRVDPPRELMRVGMLATIFQTQLSSDFRIWVVPPFAQRPVLPPPAQPTGFPLSVR